MNLSDINWDFNAAGAWPLPIRAATIAIVCVLVAGAGVYYDTLPQTDELAALEKQEEDLKLAFDQKQEKAINLQDYLAQLEEIEASLGEMVKQMPTKAEVASLLIDISQTGLANGLEFKLFQPKQEVHKEFYTELPIDIEVIGHYAQLGSFVSGLASLPRVVTVHDVNIQPLVPNDAPMQGKVRDARLHMNATIKTYNEQGAEVSATATPKIRKGSAQ
ncbi:MAG: type 4a pilus biogenesis protein PilO [Methylococcales bacterium]|nr:type 4a pilus biogenesis protein PilO [Methylococcales bacterium]